MNPPYDSRVEIDNIYDFYKSIGDCLKNYWQGSDAWVFTSRADAMKSFGLRSTRKFTLDNGGTESKLYKFELYKGSKKAKHQS
jgi:putative N6-adenine-specific DNA methylase